MTRHKKILLEQTLREVQYGADIKRDGHMRSKCMRLRLITNTSFQVATISRDIVIQNVSAIQQLCYLITLWLYLFAISLFTPNFYYLNQAEWVKLIFIIYHFSFFLICQFRFKILYNDGHFFIPNLIKFMADFNFLSCNNKITCLKNKSP